MKHAQLVKVLREEVPKTGWRVSVDAFNKNHYKGSEIGPLGVADLA